MRAIAPSRWLIALAGLLASAAVACARGPTVRIVASDGKPLAQVKVEIAATNQQREFGLMYRDHLGEDDGMIFLFPAPSPHKFWMKNTKLPLDMIFADGNRVVVGVVADAVPYSEDPVGPDEASQFVLEVNGGFAARHHIGAGSRFEFEGLSPRTGQ